ncbi:MAG: FliH/SctL family protein [Bacillota bacterium]
MREARQRSREIIAASEVKVVELAMAAAERLLQTQLEMAPEKVIHIVREAMRLMGGGEKMAVYVSPPDLGACLGMQEKMKAEFSEVNRLEFLPDEALSRGSCRIESENGTAEYLLHEESRQLKEMLLAIARREETKQLEEEEPAYGKH